MQPKIDVEEVSRAVKTALAGLYGDRLEKVILYGSYARGDFHEESDIDFLVVLRDAEVQVFREIRAMVPALLPIGLRLNLTISCHPITVEKFRRADFSFIQNIRREGVLV